MVRRHVVTERASQANCPVEQIPIRLERSLRKKEAAALDEQEDPGHLAIEVCKVLMVAGRAKKGSEDEPEGYHKKSSTCPGGSQKEPRSTRAVPGDVASAGGTHPAPAGT